MVTTYGSAGMSSDELDIDENNRRVYYVHKPTWHREIDLWLQIINDNCGTSVDSQGSHPREQLWGFKFKSTHSTVLGLPCSFYNQEWLRRQ